MDLQMQGGERYRIGPDRYINFIHTPGHTWGHTVVYDEGTKTMIAAEAALHKSILGLDGQPALPPTYCYISTYEATLERLISMDIDIYSPAHWPVQHGNEVKTFLSESLSFCRENEQKLLDLLRSSRGPLTLKEIIQEMNEEIGTWPASTAQDLSYPIAGHLARLLSRDLIAETSQEELSAYLAR
jgi:glyoxylase-like metal-dependent hydrolase (beta-lactamase superfamily II)